MGMIHRGNAWVNAHLQNILKIWLVIFTILALFLLFQSRQRGIDNKHRINDIHNLVERIQQSRIDSCRQNYQAIINSFAPFGKRDNPQTPLNEKEAIGRFVRQLQLKKANCPQQVSPRRVKNGQ